MSKQKRSCKFLDKYAEEYPFMKKGRTETEGYCSHCKSYLSISHGGISDIKAHIMTTKHVCAVNSSASCRKITSFFVKPNTTEADQVIAAELSFSYHIIKHHQSFVSASCTNKLFPKIFSDSKISKKYASGATKSTCMITKVLAPHSVSVAVNEINSSFFYSLSTDASNHLSEKIFPLVVQYFTLSGTKVKLLKLGNLKRETADLVANFCIQSLKDLNLELKNCVAFSGDNANVNFGGRMRAGTNNIFTKLKGAIGGQIEGIGCPAHVVYNTLETACDQLSCDAGMIVFKLFNYFSIYTVRTERLKDFCAFVSVEFKKLLSYTKTRWLSLLPSIERVLKIFDGLKSFFLSEDKAPKVLLDFFNNPLSEAYFWFIHSQASSVSFLILKIEGKNQSVVEALLVLKATVSIFEEKLIQCFIPTSVRSILKKLLDSGIITDQDIEKFKKEVICFYETFCDYLKKWVKPLEHFEIFSWMLLKEKPEWKDVELVLDYFKEKEIEINDTLLFNQIQIVRAIVDSESKENLDWKFKIASEKWVCVLQKMDKNFPEQYIDLLKICEYVFAIPAHNANVERLFSLMGIHWTDERNSLSSSTVEAILQCITNFDLNCSEMYDYILCKKELLKAAKSSNKYL